MWLKLRVSGMPQASGHIAHENKRMDRVPGAAWNPRAFSVPVLVPNHVNLLETVHWKRFITKPAFP